MNNQATTTVTRTRYRYLGFSHIARGLWMFIDMETTAQIGPQYKTKDELLADVRNFADERGFALA